MVRNIITNLIIIHREAEVENVTHPDTWMGKTTVARGMEGTRKNVCQAEMH